MVEGHWKTIWRVNRDVEYHCHKKTGIKQTAVIWQRAALSRAVLCHLFMNYGPPVTLTHVEPASLFS
jgi:hypothetical protein